MAAYRFMNQQGLAVEGFEVQQTAFVLAEGKRGGGFVHDGGASCRGGHHVEHDLAGGSEVLQGVARALVPVNGKRGREVGRGG